MIKNKQIKSIWLENVFCDKCGDPMCSCTMLTSNPPQYIYKCEKCGTEENYKEVFPRINYEVEE